MTRRSSRGSGRPGASVWGRPLPDGLAAGGLDPGAVAVAVAMAWVMRWCLAVFRRCFSSFCLAPPSHVSHRHESIRCLTAFRAHLVHRTPLLGGGVVFRGAVGVEHRLCELAVQDGEVGVVLEDGLVKWRDHDAVILRGEFPGQKELFFSLAFSVLSWLLVLQQPWRVVVAKGTRSHMIGPIHRSSQGPNRNIAAPNWSSPKPPPKNLERPSSYTVHPQRSHSDTTGEPNRRCTHTQASPSMHHL